MKDTPMLFHGFGPLLLAGTWVTIKLAVLSLAASFALGLVGAAAKLSTNRVISRIGTLYTTLIRAVPDLVLMLLLFYSIQIWLNDLTDMFSMEQIDIDPFSPASSRWASFTARTSQKHSAARFSPCRADRSKRASPTA